jgi:hypothetical protein
MPPKTDAELAAEAAIKALEENNYYATLSEDEAKAHKAHLAQAIEKALLEPVP